MFKPGKPTLQYQLTFEGLWPTAVAFLGSGRRIAAGNQRGQIAIWDLPEKAPEFKTDPKNDRKAPNVWPSRILDGHTNEITKLIATPDGKHLVSASYDRTVRIWPTDAPAAGKTEVIFDEDQRLRDAKRAGKKVIEASAGISVEKQTACEVLIGHKEWIYALGMSHDGTRMISGDAGAHVIVWDVATRKPMMQWDGHPWNWIVGTALSPDGKIAVVSEHRYKRDDFDVPTPALKTWDANTGKEQLDILKVQFPKFDAKSRTYGSSQMWRKFVAAGLIALAVSPDGKFIAAGQGGETGTGTVHILDATTGKLVRDVAVHKEGVTAVLFTADSKYLFSAGRDTSVRVSQISDGKEVMVCGAPRGGQFKDWYSAVALSPDERTVAATDIAGAIHVWE